jgi:hypothetical protein
MAKEVQMAGVDGQDEESGIAMPSLSKSTRKKTPRKLKKRSKNHHP